MQIIKALRDIIPVAVAFAVSLIAGPVQAAVELDCMVKPDMYINVASPVDGVLQEVLVGVSDSVEKGQPLAQLDAAVEKANVDIARQEANMDNLVRAKQLRYDYALKKEKRIANLHRAKASSSQEYDDALIEKALAQTELLQAKLDQQRNALRLELALAQLEQKTIRSPIDGVVVERYLLPGESVENQSILQLAKIDPLMVEVLAPAELFDDIHVGMRVEVFPDLPVGSQYQAKVSVKDRIIDAASGSFNLKLMLPNPDEKLVGGTKCRAQFDVSVDLNRGHRADDQLPEDIRALLNDSR